MRRVFLLNSDPGPSGPAALTALLAAGLPRDRFTPGVGLIGEPDGSMTAALLTAGVVPVALPWRWALDIEGWLKLRKAVADFAPDVLHAIGPAAVRLAPFLATGKRRPAVVASGADRREAGFIRWLSKRGLRAAGRVTARTQAEAERYKGVGVPGDRITVIAPGVSAAPPTPDPAAFRRSLDIPENGRLIIAAGRFDVVAGLKSAVWAFDVVKYVHPDLYLVLVGDGPQRHRVERFARGLGFDDFRVRFAGTRTDLAAALGLAELVWVTHERGGVATALEAMAAGVPVIAANTPDLAAVVEDGVTGRFYPPADRIRLAAVAHDLLGDPDAARRLGTAGRERALAEFPAGRLIERFAAAYDDLATKS